ncbi:DUF2188 domain-containing protein [Martelella lutilitoris]|nr:DUF2188 domain-containing protein [Martelella lutilitoris]
MTKALLHEIAAIRNGTTFKADDGGVPFVQGRHLRGGYIVPGDFAFGAPPVRSFAEAQLRSGDVLVDTRGTVNWAAPVETIDSPLFAILDIAIVRLSSARVLPAYLALFLNLPTTQSALAMMRSTATIPRLGLGALAELEIPIPSIQVQERMVALDYERRHQTHLNEKLGEARNRLTDEILRRSAEGQPMPDGNPAWAIHRQTNLARERLANPPFEEGNRIMSNKKSPGKGGTTHVVPAKDGGWNVKRGGASRASGHFDTKQQAVDRAREISRNAQSELKIHNQDGRIAQSDSHGNDPRDVKG